MKSPQPSDIQPLNSLILIEIQKKDKATASGIILHEEDIVQEGIGRIISMGLDADASVLGIGMLVLFNLWNTVEVPDQKELRLVREDALLAIIHEE